MLCLAGAAGLHAQPLSCNVSGDITNTKRSFAELLGDVIVRCTGGTPTPPGAQVPQTDIEAHLNRAVTGRLLDGAPCF